MIRRMGQQQPTMLLTYIHAALAMLSYSMPWIKPIHSMAFNQSTLPTWSFLAACPCNPSGGYCDGYGGCICYPGYTGQYCEVLACRCNPSGGYCDYYYGNCICYPGYTGQYCDEMLGREKPCRQEGRTHSLVHGACLLLGSAVWTDRCHISLHSCIL